MLIAYSILGANPRIPTASLSYKVFCQREPCRGVRRGLCRLLLWRFFRIRPGIVFYNKNDVLSKRKYLALNQKNLKHEFVSGGDRIGVLVPRLSGILRICRIRGSFGIRK